MIILLVYVKVIEIDENDRQEANASEYRIRNRHISQKNVTLTR